MVPALYVNVLEKTDVNIGTEPLDAFENSIDVEENEIKGEGGRGGVKSDGARRKCIRTSNYTDLDDIIPVVLVVMLLMLVITP
jgi:hypothetical protein